MKKGYLFILLIFLLSCTNSDQSVLLDSFEGKINQRTVDFGSSEGTSLSVSAAKDIKSCGQQALKISYDLKPSGYMWIARGYNLDVGGAAAWEVKPQDIAWDRYNSFSLDVYGADSGGFIAFDLKDKGGEIWRFLIEDDFEGWKNIVCSLVDFFPRQDWQPETAEKNDILDFPIMSFQFEPFVLGSNDYYFDCVSLKNVKK